MSFNPLTWVTALTDPIAKAYQAKQELKAAKETAKAKITMSKQDNDYKVELSDQEWEALALEKSDTTWKDEYVTVSIVSIVNLIVVGGLAAAFGEPRVLEGMAIAIQALVAAGVDLAFIINAVVLAAIGLKIWRR